MLAGPCLGQQVQVPSQLPYDKWQPVDGPYLAVFKPDFLYRIFVLKFEEPSIFLAISGLNIHNQGSPRWLETVQREEIWKVQAKIV